MSIEKLLKYAEKMENKYGQKQVDPELAAHREELQTLRATLGSVFQRVQQLEQRVQELEQKVK